ncbi:hypothetical protein BC943DRAFT_363949 [Umbelopsis sp. AD052]|nr:hypothetical protein BC943DRAFT_363949 [Umbelopsis sp. AD052]
MSDQLQTWVEFKTNPSSKALYTHDASVIFVPTSVGARGPEQIATFFRHDDFSERNVHVKEKMHNRVMSGEKLIEEADWTITLHKGECLWLAPTVAYETLLGSTVVIPVVRSAIFDDGLILSVRVYWDQASVLQQLNVLSTRKGIPIRGIEQVEALRNPQTARLNTWGDNSAPAAAVSPKREEQKTRNHLLPGRVFGGADAEPEPERSAPRKIGPEARNIFTYQPKEEKKRNVAYNPKKYESSLKFDEAPVETPSVKGIKPHSSFSLSGEDAVAEHIPSVRSSAPPPRNIFDYKPEEAKTIAFNPKKNQSSFTFGPDPAAIDSLASPTSPTIGAHQQLSSLSLEDEKKPVVEQTPIEAAPAEQTEATNGDVEEEVEEEVEQPTSAFVATPMFGQPLEQPKEESFSGRPRSARSNQSQFSIGGEQAHEASERSFSGRPRTGLSNQSSFSFGQPESEVEHQPAKPVTRRDPNASAFSLFGEQTPDPKESVSATGKRLFKQPESREQEAEKPRVRLVKVPGQPNRNIFG